MMEPFANANETFKKLFDTGQQLNEVYRRNVINQRNLQLREERAQANPLPPKRQITRAWQNSKLEKEEKAHRELKTKFDELKKDFMHNLDLNKDLQSKVNELCSEKNALKTRLGLVQGDISEAVNKREMANARTEKAQVEKAKIEKELHDAHKLHASLTGVIHAEHKKFVDSLLQKHALEIENFKNSLQSLDIKLQSQRQELRLDYTRKRAKDKHELHQCITSANQERDRANLKLTAVENEKQNLELFIKALEKDLEEKSATITSVSERLAHCELVIEENKAISKDYAQQIEKQFKEIQAHYEKKEFEWSNKIGVLEKQLRIECSKSEQMRVETDAQISVLEKAKNNIESLLHQEQVLHKTLREEHERDKQNYQSSLKMAEEKSCSFQKRAVELSEVETQLIAQNKTLQTITESQAQKIEEMLKANSEAAAEHDKEKNYFANNETNLRMQIHRLRDVVKDMKADIETVESEDAKKLKIREEKLCEKERIIAKERAEFENEKANFKGSRAAREGSQESPGMTLELQNALEECVVLRQEKQTLLERCNKLSHELKRATRSLENGAAASEEKDRPLSAVENLQYELTKKQLGLVALERHRVPYNPTEYTGSACDLPTHENSFLDSEVVSLSSLPNTELSQFEAEDVPVKLPSRKQFKRQLPRQPINYNSLKPTT